MKHLLSTLTLLGAVMLGSCGSDSTQESATPVSTTSSQDGGTKTLPDLNSANSDNGNAVSTVNNNNPASGAPASSVALNPAHGQPGHRCDIAVGAPLNSPPGAKAAPSVSSTPTSTGPNPLGKINPTVLSTPSTSTPATGTTKAGLNPAHGQPGHRCDIAVGAPLNSPPGAKASGSTGISTTPLQGSNPNISLPKQSAPVNTSPLLTPPANGNVKLNPAHGQPGHRCDLKVGAPLPNS